MNPLCVPNAQSFSVDGEDRPSSTSVVATLRHSPRLLLRKKTSSNSTKEPQSPDIFARGPGRALRPSTRLQTRISRMSARAKKSPSTTITTTSTTATNACAAEVADTTQALSIVNGRPNTAVAAVSELTLAHSSTASNTSNDSSPSPSCISDAMDVSRPVSPASSTTGRLTRSTLQHQQQLQQQQQQQQQQHQRLPPSPSPSEGNTPELHERPSRVATRSISQSRERESSRLSSRTRARSRLSSNKKAHSSAASTGDANGGRRSRKEAGHELRLISLRRPESPICKEGMDDEDADDDEEDRFSSPRVLRASARHRRRSFKDPSSTSIGTDRSGQTTSEIDTRSRLTRSRYARYIRQNGEHARGLAMDDGNDEDHGLKIKKPSAEVARLDTSTDGSQSVAALAVPRKARQAQNTDRKVPNLPLGRRRLRARSTKVARMGIDDNGEVDDDEDEDEDGEAGDDDDEQEADGEEEDVEYDQYPKSDQDEECRFKQGLSSSKGSLQQQQQEQEQQHSQQQNQQCVLSTSPSAQDTLALLDGFIASKPETPGTHVVTNSAAQNLTHFKRKVEEDEEMEDAPISADEGQLVSTKLARIDDSDGQERSAYMRSLYNILKSPRDDDDGILSSESEDADLESEDDEDDFEEIDVWEFIATLPPLGPLPPNFVSTMPDKTPDTPPITLVLDIDETLVHCATRPLESPDIIFPVEYNQETWEVYGRIRPGMLEFLEKMSAKFEVITFTASQECYAEALLKIIDPEKKYIKHRYYRDSCVPVFGNYVKDLRILNRDLAKVVIIDNSPQAFGYQLSNGIPIESWYEDKSDRELAKVMEFLETLNGVDDVRPKIDEHFRLSERIQKALAAANHHQNNSLSELEFGNRLPSTSMSSIDVCTGSDNSVALGATLANHVDAVTNTTSASDLLLSGGDMGMSDLHQQALAGLVDLDPRMLYTDGSLMQIDQEAISIEAPDETIAFAACASGLSISATSTTTTTTTINGMTTHTSDSAGNVTTMTIKTRSNSLEAAHNLARITL